MALQRPGVFPLRTLAQARVGVAQHGQEGHRFGSDELGHDLGEVESRVARVQLGDLHESGVGAHHVGQAVDGGELGRVVGGGGPQVRGFQPVEQPIAQRGALQVFPARRVPAALVFGALDQADVAVALDQVDATLDDLPIVLGPVRRDLGDRR